MIRVEGLSKRYGKLWALRGVSCSFRPGEVTALIGPNGSGKTTLIKSILGAVRPTEGKLWLGDTPIGTDPAYRARLGYMPQIGRYPDNLTIGQLLDMMQDLRGQPTGGCDDRLVSVLGIDRQLGKKLGALSGGTRQKVSAILAFRFRPEVLILDEPTAGLDPVSAESILEAVGQAVAAGVAVVITSHIMNEVEAVANRVTYLAEGRLLFSETAADLQARTQETRLSAAIAHYAKACHG
ncbi:MAG: ABC transporter ATP-binding protein [Bacteroidia bacterium]|nr:ABC transporter ATP-binding protein [Bacteroidia bacterium]